MLPCSRRLPSCKHVSHQNPEVRRSAKEKMNTHRYWFALSVLYITEVVSQKMSYLLELHYPWSWHMKMCRESNLADHQHTNRIWHFVLKCNYVVTQTMGAGQRFQNKPPNPYMTWTLSAINCLHMGITKKNPFNMHGTMSAIPIPACQDMNRKKEVQLSPSWADNFFQVSLLTCTYWHEIIIWRR